MRLRSKVAEKKASPNKSNEGGTPKPGTGYGEAMRRLIYVVVIGGILIVAFGFRRGNEGVAGFFGVITVGLMTGGAALMSGGLLGFLFGVPHTRVGSADQGSEETTEGWSEPGKAGSRDGTASYRPNTSLEQISDWLTKMLVGVGLIEIKEIPGKLTAMAAYIAKGIGNEPQSETFAVAILIYFSVCGFAFGFLWARLYLPKWFREADTVQEQVQKLEEKVSRFERQQEADARALALVTRQINPEAGEPLATEQELAEAIKESSSPARITIFSLAEKARADKETSGNDLRVQGIVSIFKGLVASDDQNQYHRNHSSLAHALRIKKEYEGAATEFTKAIEIRDRRGLKGWKSYEFYRALSRIESDPKFRNNQPSDAADVKKVCDDLGVIYADTEKWSKYYQDNKHHHEIVKEWMDKNSLTVDDLGPG